MRTHVDDNGHIDVSLLDSQANRRLFATPRNGGSAFTLRFARTDRVTNRAAALQFARTGLGAVMVMKGSVEVEIKESKLVELLPDHDFGAARAARLSSRASQSRFN